MTIINSLDKAVHTRVNFYIGATPTIRAPTVSFSSRTAPTHLRSRHKRSCKASKPIDSVPSPNSGDRQPPKQNRQTVTFVKRNTPTSIHQLHNPAPPARSAKFADAHFHDYHLIYNLTQPHPAPNAQRAPPPSPPP